MAMDELKSMREAVGEALIDAGEANHDLVVVGADTTESLSLSPFGRKFQGRLFNVGIAEQNMHRMARLP